MAEDNPKQPTEAEEADITAAVAAAMAAAMAAVKAAVMPTASEMLRTSSD